MRIRPGRYLPWWYTPYIPIVTPVFDAIVCLFCLAMLLPAFAVEWVAKTILNLARTGIDMVRERMGMAR